MQAHKITEKIDEECQQEMLYRVKQSMHYRSDDCTYPLIPFSNEYVKELKLRLLERLKLQIEETELLKGLYENGDQKLDK